MVDLNYSHIEATKRSVLPVIEKLAQPQDVMSRASDTIDKFTKLFDSINNLKENPMVKNELEKLFKDRLAVPNSPITRATPPIQYSAPKIDSNAVADRIVTAIKDLSTNYGNITLNEVSKILETPAVREQFVKKIGDELAKV